MDINKFVGSKIKKYRKKAGMTQAELGELLGVKQNTVAGYEKGDWEVSYDNLFVLAEKFDIKVDDLFPSTKSGSDNLQRAMDLPEARGMDTEDMLLIKRITEKALSLESAERKRLMDSIRFATDYFDKTDK